MKKMSLKFKLVLSFLIAGLIPMIVVGLYSYSESHKALESQAIGKLDAVKNIKKSSITHYFESIRDQVLTFSHSTETQEAMVAFKKAFHNYSNERGLTKVDTIVHKSSLKNFYTNEFGAKYEKENGEPINSLGLLNQLNPNELALQYEYISNNQNPLGSKETLNFADDGTSYANHHKKYHPSIREYLQKFGYYDIFLVDIKTGHIVYSVFKELDYATSLLTGPYQNTNFAQAFKKGRDIYDQNSFAIVDFKQYAPSYEAPASFIASPVWVNGEKVGVAIFQMPIDRINGIMGQRDGMGKTGESYIFGADRLMRSNSFLDEENRNVVASFKNKEKGSVNTEAVNAALAGETGNKITNNYLGQEVISSYAPIEILGMKWGIISEINTDEALAAVGKIRNATLIMLGISGLLIVLFAFFLSGSLAKQIQAIATRLLGSSKEVAISSDSISVSSSELSEAATEAASSLQETVSSIDEISSMIQRNADAASSSTQVSTKSNEAAAKGKETVELMIQSINEISGSNEDIAKEMSRNSEDISRIVTVISEIGEKTKVINDIVFQTKLLSFNASVEAARAGEHGKGFAVVAEEVGNLASMSGKAALEITEMLDSSIKQVTEIVDESKKKVEVLVNNSKEKVDQGTKTAHECGDVLDEILLNVSSVNEMVREIATASAEQSTGVQEVTKAMQQLDQTTHQNTSVAQESSTMARKLKNQADDLNVAVQELMSVVSGSDSFTINKQNHHQNDESNSNVIKFKANEKSPQPHKNLKVSGLDTEIPSENDDRFEDL